MMYSVNTVKTSSNAIYHPDPKVFMELRNAGLTNAEIARKTGFNYNTVLRYIGLQPKKTDACNPQTGTGQPSRTGNSQGKLCGIG